MRLSMLRTWQTVALAAIALTVLPSAALADGDGGGDILAPRFDLGIWTIVVFVGLLVILSRTAWKPMLEGLKKREETIRSSIEEAKKTRDEMEQLRTKFKIEMDQAYAKIPLLMDEARREAQQMQEEMRTKAAA